MFWLIAPELLIKNKDFLLKSLQIYIYFNQLLSVYPSSHKLQAYMYASRSMWPVCLYTCLSSIWEVACQNVEQYVCFSPFAIHMNHKTHRVVWMHQSTHYTRHTHHSMSLNERWVKQPTWRRQRWFVLIIREDSGIEWNRYGVGKWTNFKITVSTIQHSVLHVPCISN